MNIELHTDIFENMFYFILKMAQIKFTFFICLSMSYRNDTHLSCIFM